MYVLINWETLTRIIGDLSYGQALNGVKFDFHVKYYFDWYRNQLDDHNNAENCNINT